MNQLHQRWLDGFRARHGRAPRVLHIGNIANNAYNNAKVLNAAGVESHVLCYDYYHLMGSPEWEDADFEGCPTDHYRPDWSDVDLHGFERPRWFAQGPLALCIQYLTALNAGEAREHSRLWVRMSRVNGTVAESSGAMRRIRERANRFANTLSARTQGMLLMHQPLQRIANWLHSRTASPSPRENAGLFLVGLMLLLIAPLRALLAPFGAVGKVTVDPAHAEAYARLYNRPVDDLQIDFLSFLPGLAGWKTLLGQYDLIQAYATDPIWPYLAGKRPYVAFEHGTLRELSRGLHIRDRVAAVAYMAADHVLITNGDCLEHARKLGIENFSPILHPLNTPMFARANAPARWAQERYGKGRVFLCPVRHDWEIKGTDVHIRAMPLIRDRIGDDFCVVFVRWGQEVARSTELIALLGVAANARWIEPIAHHSLARHMSACDAVLDQIRFPTFGGIAPEALAAGVPVIMSYDPKATEWIVSRPAPVLAAWTPEQVADHVANAVNPGFRRQYAIEAQRWVRDCHSLDAVLETHLRIYSRLIDAARSRRP